MCLSRASEAENLVINCLYYYALYFPFSICTEFCGMLIWVSKSVGRQQDKFWKIHWLWITLKIFWRKKKLVAHSDISLVVYELSTLHREYRHRQLAMYSIGAMLSRLCNRHAQRGSTYWDPGAWKESMFRATPRPLQPPRKRSATHIRYV